VGSREFRALEREWYARLKATGFDDIEYACTTPGLFLPAGTSLQTIASEYDPATEEYFAKARAWVHDGTFADAVCRFIWEAHAEGCTSEAILRALRRGEAGEGPWTKWTSALPVKRRVYRMKREMLGR